MTYWGRLVAAALWWRFLQRPIPVCRPELAWPPSCHWPASRRRRSCG